MKTPYLLITGIWFFSLILLQFCVYGQKEQKTQKGNRMTTINLDFKTKTFSDTGIINLEKLHRGDLYQIIINNINLNLYRVNISKTDSFTGSALQFPTFTSLGSDALTALLGNITSLGGILSIINKKDSTAKVKLNNSIDNFSVQPEGTKSIMLTEKNAENQDSLTVYTHRLEIQDKINSFNKSINEKANSVLETSTKLDNIGFSVKTAVFLSQLEDETIKCPKPPEDPVSLICSVMTSFPENKEKLKKITKELKNEYEAYVTYIKINKDFLKDKDDLKEADTSVRKNAESLIKAIEEILVVLTPDNFEKLIASLKNVLNNKERKYTSLPQEFTRDKAFLKINIGPRDTSTNLPYYYTELHFPLNSYTFFGVSSDLYLSGLYSDGYSVKDSMDIDTVHNYSLVRENSEKMEFGLAALIHFGVKPFKQTDLNIHIAFGPGISFTKKIEPRLLAGGGIAYGNKHKLLLTAGIIMGYVDRLSNAYQIPGVYKEQPTSVLVSVFKSSWFIAMGYVFTL